MIGMMQRSNENAAVSFTVPGSPVGKGRPRIGRVGAHSRMFTPHKTAAYEGLVAHAGQQAMAGRPLIEGAVSVPSMPWR